MLLKIRPGPRRVSPPAPGPAGPLVMQPRAPMKAPQFAPAAILQTWTQGIPQSMRVAAIPFAWSDHRVPIRAPDLTRTWYQPTPLPLASQFITLRSPMQAPQFGPVRIQQAWTQNLLLSTLAPPPSSTPFVSNIFALPIAPARIPQGWLSPAMSTPFSWSDFRVPQRAAPIIQTWLGPAITAPPVTPPFVSPPSHLPQRAAPLRQTWVQGPPLPLTSVTITLRAPMQAPMRLHWFRDREYLSFDSTSYGDPVPPVDTVFRAGHKAPQFPPHRLKQFWNQNTPLALSSQNVYLRAPMQAPRNHERLLAFRSAPTPVNLMPLQATIAVTVRYHVIGSFVVRRFK